NKQAALELAQMVEGHLLAAAQEIEKLSLLQQAAIDLPTIENSVTDHARFDIFNLVDSALAGDSNRSLRILDNLLTSHIEPTLLLWAITRELRTLADMKHSLNKGGTLANIFNQFRVWEKRKSSVSFFLKRQS